MHAIRKGQVRWVAKGDPVAQRPFIHTIFGIARSSRQLRTVASPFSVFEQN
jgi:hypothetical protein